MDIIKKIASAAVFVIVLPVVVVGVLGIMFSPLQMSANATEPRIVLEANDWESEDAQVGEEAPGESAEEPDEDAEDGAIGQPSETLEVVPQPEEEYLEWDAWNSGANADSEGVPGEPAASEASGSAPAGGSSSWYTSDQLRTQGVIYDGDYRYTWYSQRVLPGGGLAIDGRHVSDEGYVVDSQERIVVASTDLPHGTEIDVPFGGGKGVVLDSGCASGTLDIYTDF